MTERMKVSFVIPAHNEERLLGATLETMHSAADEVVGEGRYEVLVVDDSSTDSTAAVAAAFAARGTRVLGVSHRQISKTRRSGAAEATGDLLIFVDADTLVNAPVLRAAMSAIEKGAVGGGAGVRMDAGVPLWGRMMTEVLVQSFYVLRYTGGCFFYCTRKAYEATEGWDESLFAGEEIAMARSLKRLGRFVVVRKRVTTSGRKLRTHSLREIMTLIARAAWRGGRLFRSRDGLDIWYGERRHDS